MPLISASGDAARERQMPHYHPEFKERLRKAGLFGFASGRNCDVTCVTINSGPLLY
jgi:hypothetical protein